MWRQKHRGTLWPWRQRLELCSCKRKTKINSNPHRLEEARKDSCSWCRGNRNSSLKNYEIIHLCCFKMKWATNPCKATGILLKCILLSEVSQYEENIYCMIATIWYYGKGKTIESKNISGFQVLWKREGWTDGTQRAFRAVKVFYMVL